MPDIFEDAHFAARDMLPEVPHPLLGVLNHPGIVPKLSATPGKIMHSGPDLGQDTYSVLTSELGLTQEEMDALVARGVISCGVWASFRSGRDVQATSL
jgi:crotonobetainyl-CoA:carnitine CoA-transferase CaiB-like acyl-CoA transferase